MDVRQGFKTIRIKKDVVKPHQGNIEKLLLKYLSSSSIVRPSRPIRQIIARSFVYLYSNGDCRTLFDTLAACQNILANKKLDDQAVKLAVIYTVGVLTETHGAKVMSLFPETASLYIKVLKNARDTEVPLRYETLKASARAVRGAGKAANDATIKDFYRYAKNGISDKLPIIKCVSAELLEAVYNHTQQLPPATLPEYEALIASFLKALENSNYLVRRSMASLISSLFKISLTPGSFAKVAPKKNTKQPIDPAVLAEKTILTEEEVLNLFATLFLKSTMREARVGLIEALIIFLRQSGVKFVETHYPLILKAVIGIISNPKLIASKTEWPFVRDSCAFLLRDGVGKLLAETGHKNSVREILTSHLKKWPPQSPSDAIVNEQAIVFCLNELDALLNDLGPAASGCHEGLIEMLFTLLSHPSPSVKLSLAWTFRTLCLALPEHLSLVLNKLVSLLQKDVANMTSDRPETMERAIGCANVLSAVVSDVPLRALYAVYEDAAVIFGLSVQLLKTTGSSPQRDFAMATTQATISWTLIGSLMSLGPNFVKVHISQLLLMWKSIFSKPQPKDLTAQRSEQEWFYLIASREAAMTALHSFLHFNSTELVTLDFAKRIVVCLNNSLQFFSTINATYGAPPEQAQISAMQQKLYERECLLKKRLFDCFREISPATLYESSHIQLLKSALDAFALDPDKPDRFLLLPGMAAKEGTIIIESVMPSSLFNKYSISVAAEAGAEDRGVSKMMDRDTDVQALENMIDCKSFGQLEHDPSSIYLASCVELMTTRRHGELHDSGLFSFAEKAIIRPAPPSPAITIVDSAIELFAMLYPKQNIQSQETLMEAVLKAATISSGKITPMRKYASHVNALTAVIGVLKYIMAKKGQLSSNKVSVIIRDLVEPFIKSSDPTLRAAACEILGRLARVVGTSAFVNPLIQNLVDQVVSNREPDARSGSALALGCIHSFVGGMAASSHLKTVVGILHSLSSDPHPVVHTWALHALCLTVESAGLMYGPFVNSTLTLLAQLSICESHEPCAVGANMPGETLNLEVYPAFGRILHSLLGVIGPELQMSTSVRDVCFSLYEQLRNDEDPFVVVEAIRCIQNFILFARKYVDLEVLIPFLQMQLTVDYRTQVYLIRKASVTCLYQLTQTDPDTVLSATIVNQLEEQLFALLDVEMDPMVRDEIKDILMSLLRHVAPSNPSRWLDLCKNILAKSAPSDPASVIDSPQQNQQTSASNTSGEPALGNEDDDDGLDGPTASQSGGASGSQTNKSLDTPSIANKPLDAAGKSTTANLVVVLLPRWRTQIFALSCLRQVIHVVSQTNQPEHFDLGLARKKRAEGSNKAETSDFLVFRLVELIRIAFNSSTANVDDLRLSGLYLLNHVLEVYAEVPDPDFDSHPLLEQYQAQIIAALAPAFNKESSPEIIATACGVCSFFIGINADVASMGRPLKLLGNLLDQFKGESVVKTLPSPIAYMMLKLAVLKAWADLYLCTSKMADLKAVISPHMDVLVKLWSAVLQDYSKLKIDKEYAELSGDSNGSANSSADNGISAPGMNVYMSASRQATAPYYEKAWIPILQAVCHLMLNKETAIMHLIEQLERMSLDSSDATKPVKSNGPNAKLFFTVFGLCIESLQSIPMTTLGGYSGTKTNETEIANANAQLKQANIFLESIEQILSPHIVGEAFLPTLVTFELFSLYERLVQSVDASVQLTIVKTLQQIIGQFSEAFFIEPEGKHPLSFGSLSNVKIHDYDQESDLVDVKIYKIVKILFVVFTSIPALAVRANATANAATGATATSLLLVAFETLSDLVKCSSINANQQVLLLHIYFSVLSVAMRSSTLSTDLVPRVLPQIKQVSESIRVGLSSEAATSLTNCLIAAVNEHLGIALDVISDEDESDGQQSTAVASSRPGLLRNACMAIMLIVTTHPKLSYHPQTQEKLVSFIKTLLDRDVKATDNNNNAQYAALGCQYARTLILLSCRAEESEMMVGRTYLRLLLPILVARIRFWTAQLSLPETEQLSKSGSNNLSGVLLSLVEEGLKTLVLLIGNAPNEQHKLATVAVTILAFLMVMRDVGDDSSSIGNVFPTEATKSLHVFATHTLIQFATQMQSIFKQVLQQCLNEDEKTKLERSFKSLLSVSRQEPSANDALKPVQSQIGNPSVAPKIQLKKFAEF